MTEVAVREESAWELDLLRDWPEERSRSYWLVILTASVLLHFAFFFIAVRLPTFVLRTEPQRHVLVRHTPLYIPRDILTQRAPNRQTASKNIDLSDLLSAPSPQARQASAKTSVRRFELPKEIVNQKTAKTAQILPEAPKVALNEATGVLPPGALTGLTPPSPPPPSPKRTETPFQNIGSDAPVDPRPTLKPPKAGVQSAITELAQNSAGRRLVVSDDSPPEDSPGLPGSTGTASPHHASVELESDPQGADFRPYLARILAIVRANWRRVIPESARLGTLRGRTTVEFIVSRDGSIPKVVTADSSGSEPLDRAATAGLSMSNPLPPLPPDYKGFQVRLAFSFAYNMPGQ